MTILVCGEALYDVFVADETAGGFALDARIGGSALNVATGLARLGHPVKLVTGVSTDRFGERLIASMESEGIGTDALKRTDAPSTLALVSTGASGSPAYRFYGEGAADRQMEVRDLPPLDGVETIVFGCFSMLTQPTGDAFLTFAQQARSSAHPPLIVLDPNVRLAVEPDVEVWRDRIGRFARFADIVKVSREDLAAIYGAQADLAIDEWLSGGVRAVVVTDGANGSMLLDRNGTAHAAATEVSVVDTVGAGDSYLAALLAALFDLGLFSVSAFAGRPPDSAARILAFATAAAATTCSRRGADLPRRPDLPPL